MKTLLATFGDSWTYGSELENPQTECWTAQLSHLFDDVYNMGVPASSLGHLFVQLEKLLAQVDLQQYDTKVFVFGLTSPSRYLMYDNRHKEYVNVTTEAVYYTQCHDNGTPPDVAQHLLDFAWEFYREVESTPLRVMTASMIVSSLQAWCGRNAIQDIYVSYFENQTFNQFVDLDKIIDRGQALNLPKECFTHQHPNRRGHQHIANIVKARL